MAVPRDESTQACPACMTIASAQVGVRHCLASLEADYKEDPMML
jgi:hypothetical protein